LLGKKVKSTVYELQGGQCEVKDIRDYFFNLLKQNTAFLETLFTDYYYINPQYEKEVLELRQYAEKLSRYDEAKCVKCMLGMAKEKVKLMCKVTPQNGHIIKQYGYEGKMLHHAMRLKEFLTKYTKRLPFKECLQATDVELLKLVKRNEMYNLETALEVGKRTIEICELIVKQFEPKPVKVEVEKEMEEILLTFLEKYVDLEL
jgi:hypothetical protein